MSEVPQAPKRRNGGGRGCCAFMFAGFFIGAGLVVFLVAVASGYLPMGLGPDFGFGPGVAVLEIRGELYDERPILEHLEYLAESSDTKALVVRVDSPGGVVTVMEEVYAAITRVKTEKSIPVVASMGTVAASGGYYVCLAADRIYANATSITGSIGAVFEYYNAEPLLTTVGVEHETIDSGPFKSMGSIAEPLSDRQRVLLQGVVDDIESEFVKVVQDERAMTPEKAASLADGRVYTGRQALEVGLVDDLGDLHAAVQYAAAQAGLGEDFRVIRIPHETHIQFRWLDLLGSLSGRYSPSGIVPKYVFK